MARARHSNGVRANGVRAKDSLGLTFVPPGWVSPLVEHARAAIARFQRSLAPPPVRVLEGLFGLLDNAALGALCTLDIFDSLDRPVAPHDLAGRLGVDPEAVDRLTRYAVGRGWLGLDRRGRLRPNRVTKFLRRDHPGGWRSWVQFAVGPEVLAAAGALAAGNATDPFFAANRDSFFDWCLAHPDRHVAFDAAMSAGGRLHGFALAHALDWSAHRRICDIGGGTGATLSILLDCHPHLTGVLFDLPPVVSRAVVRERLEVIAGDAFGGLPSGCDVYLFVNVLHDWGDRQAGELLRAAADAGGAGVRVVVVEAERRRRPVDSIAAKTDLLMMALTPGGRERTRREFQALAARAGLELQRSVSLISGDQAYVFRRSISR